MITGYYGKNGIMSSGWDSEDEAEREFDEFYQGEEYEDCFVTELNGEWVIAYE